MGGPVTAPLTFNAWLRYELVSRLLNRLPQAESFVEVGCGQGALAARLARRYRYVGYEPDSTAFAVARARLAPLNRGTVVNAPLPEEPTASFDLLGAFEVLEHMKDDATTLRTWFRWLAPGGHVILSVPGHPKRFGPADEAAGHFRRYRRTDLQRVLQQAGFEEVSVLAYGFPLGYLLEWGRNRLLRRSSASIEEQTARSGRLLQPPEGAAWVTRFATAPFRLMELPFTQSDLGTGFVASARRPA